MKFIVVCFLLFLAFTLFASPNKIIDMPDVHVSYSTGKCVKVVNYTNANFSCGDLPERYIHVGVR